MRILDEYREDELEYWDEYREDELEYWMNIEWRGWEVYLINVYLRINDGRRKITQVIDFILIFVDARPPEPPRSKFKIFCLKKLINFLGFFKSLKELNLI